MKVTLYSKPGCGPCSATKHALESRGVPFETVNVMADDAALEAIKGLGYLTVPVVLVQDGDASEHWGGFQLDRIADLAGQLRMQEVEE
ncbi:glutaredoxin family protein [Paracoccus sp. MA]|uniref:glutaredoxin family protein n=1 Tax=Paracoccus sp. MA TaxID=2895796 RepID=UPI001E5403C2|nr:glutaredoxin family protein [Paracoccus sp. MA]UFM64231.1 glutaredoxin family protein [Paracoccus sp. MA]